MLTGTRSVNVVNTGAIYHPHNGPNLTSNLLVWRYCLIALAVGQFLLEANPVYTLMVVYKLDYMSVCGRHSLFAE